MSGRRSADRDTDRIVDLLPRRAAGLPAGQREVRAFPRFSDAPLRWAPRPAPIALLISIDGRDERTLDADDLEAFDPIEQTSDFHCVTTWTRRGLRWGGVRFVDVVREIVGDDLPPYMVATSADKVSAIYLTEDLLSPEVLLATHLDGEPLDAKHGRLCA